MPYDPTGKAPQFLIRDFIDFVAKETELKNSIAKMQEELKFYTEGANSIRKEMSERFAGKVFLLEEGVVARPFLESDGTPKISIQGTIKIPVAFAQKP